jgi:hypothetical protein
MCAAPLAQSQIVNATRVVPIDPPKVADQQGADLLLESEGDHLLGGLMMRLMNATPVTGFHAAVLVSVPAPATRPALARLGRPANRSGPTSLLVA